MSSEKCVKCGAYLFPHSKKYNTIDGLFCEFCIDEYLKDKRIMRDLKEMGLLADE